MAGPTWMLLITLVSTTPVITSIYWGVRNGAGIGALIGVGVGLTIGLINFYGIGALGRYLLRWAVRCKEQQSSMAWPNRISQLSILTIYFWIFVSGLLGLFITQSLIKIYHS
jgi:hypothetical protein